MRDFTRNNPFDEKNYSKNIKMFEELEEMYSHILWDDELHDENIEKLLYVAQFFINMSKLWGARYDTLLNFCEKQTSKIENLEERLKELACG